VDLRGARPRAARAARSLGMTSFAVLRKIVVPQAAFIELHERTPYNY
jgi:ABC-type amino acid transport system permease subunit